MKEHLGKKLISIYENVDSIFLEFDDTSGILYEGLIFQSPCSVVGHRVINIEKTETLGFKGITMLRYLGENTDNYEQLFIEFTGSNPEWKRELICIVKK